MGKYVTHRVGVVILERRGKVWHVRYTQRGQRVRRSLKVTNLRVAEKKAREISDLLEKGDYSTVELRKDAQTMTITDLAREFRTNYTNWNEETWRGNESRLKYLLLEFGHLPLPAVTPKAIEAFLAGKMDKDGISPATANRYLAILKTMFKMAMRWGYLPYSPADQVKLQREQSRIPQGLHEDELDRLLDHMSGYPRQLAAFAADTGLRRSEFERLQWSDIDMERRQITVRETKNREERIIPMSERVFDILQQRQEENTGKVISTNVWTKRSIRKALELAGKRARLGHIHYHMLRHTFATRMMDGGASKDDVQYLMGHKTPVMTQRYDHARPERYRRAIEALER